MLFFASLLGIAAVGASAFVGLGTEADDSVDASGDGGEAIGDEATQEGDGPDLVRAALDAVADTGESGDTGGRETEVETHTDGDADGDTDTHTATASADTLTGWQIVDGTESADTITGEDIPERFGGRGGADMIDGKGGDDELRGGEGEDDLRGGADADTLHGEGGDDTLYGEAGDDRLYGHNGADTLWGGDGDDSLVGSAGNDRLYGGAGDDALHGDLDDDRLEGGTGSDSLFGGHGNDTLSGVVDDPATTQFDDLDTGRDYLNGGGGDDVIVAGQDDIVTTGSGADSVLLGGWLDAAHQAEILDFSADEDMLMVFYDKTGATEPEIALEPDSEDATAQRLLLDGIEIAHIANAEGLTLDHVALVPQAQFPSLTGG